MIHCTTCGGFLPAAPTSVEQRIVTDYDEYGDPGCDYAVHRVKRLEVVETRQCRSCGESTETEGDPDEYN